MTLCDGSSRAEPERLRTVSRAPVHIRARVPAVAASTALPHTSSELSRRHPVPFHTRRFPPYDGLPGYGRYWARTSDLLLVRQALYQLS